MMQWNLIQSRCKDKYSNSCFEVRLQKIQNTLAWKSQGELRATEGERSTKFLHEQWNSEKLVRPMKFVRFYSQDVEDTASWRYDPGARSEWGRHRV